VRQRTGDYLRGYAVRSTVWTPHVDTVLAVWLLILTVGAAALVVLVTRGSWIRLVQLPMHGALLFIAGLVLQLLLEVVDFAPDQIERTGYALLMLSYAFLLAFCLVNLPLRGMGVIAIGIALNTLVIGLNVGMPTRDVGLDDSGRRIEEPIEQTVKHRPESDDDLLGFLGDKILLPEPFDALISIGDIVLLVGICELAYFGSHERRRRDGQRAGSSTSRRSRTRSSASSTRPSYT
jgi:Family of unknown function (DUF5317)